MTIARQYAPVVRGTPVDGQQAVALVGSHAALVGWTVDAQALPPEHLGFAVRRTDFDPATGEVLRVDWLKGQKRFRADAGSDEGSDVPSSKAPFQRFRWSEYGLSAEKSYRYEIFPLRKAAGATVVSADAGTVERGAPFRVDLRPTPPMQDGVGVYVNRGVTSAFAYLDRFRGAPPKEVEGGAAYRWLSRGLKESLLSFIAGAADGSALHVAIYEFFDAEVAQALQAAKARLSLSLVYHARPGDDATEKSRALIEDHDLEDVAVARTRTRAISHNKFAVRLEGGQPTAVWVGSSNFSENAFYFQTNAALVLERPDVAAAYERYFQVLAADPEAGRKTAGTTFAQDAVAELNAAFAAAPPFSRALFSPVRSDHVIEAAIDLVSHATSCVFVSAPFGLEAPIVKALGANAPHVLEYGLCNTTAKKKIEDLDDRHTRFVLPSVLKTYMGRAWDAKAFGNHKIHSKLIVADPWGARPRVLFGSSNHSDESCRNNDENNLLIEGDARVAAILTTEFMRMWDHYSPRSFINALRGDTTTEERFLKEDAAWSRTAFEPTAKSHKYRDRLVFSGQA